MLHIASSPREGSHSAKVAHSFIEAYKRSHPEDQVTTLNLWQIRLPPFDGRKVAAKSNAARGKENSLEEQEAWKEVTDIIAHFKSFDKFLFSIPMWNFGIPYLLKHYIDIIVQPGQTFAKTSSGPIGLVTGKPALIIYSSGSVYGESSPIDFLRPHFEFVLKFIGFTNIQRLAAEGQTDPRLQLEYELAAIEKAQSLANQW